MRIFGHRPLYLALGLVAAVLPGAPAAAAVTPDAVVVQNNTSPTRDYVVILTENASVASKVNKEEALGNDVNDVFSSKVKGFVAELDAADVRRLRQDPQVLVVEPNGTFSVGVTDESTTSTTVAPSTTAAPSTSTLSTTSTTVVPSIDDLNIGDHIPGEYIVTLRRGVGAAAFASAQVDIGIGILGTMSSAINGFGARLSKSQLSALASDSNVVLIEENTVIGVEGDQANPPSWGIDRIDQRSLPLNQNYSYNFTGSGVNAYVIDTGVRSDHQDFGGRVRAGNDEVGDGRGTEDCNGHGTHVAGIVGSQTYGVAKAVAIIPVRVLSCTGRGSIFDVLSGVDWMIEHHAVGEPAVANMSLGGGFNSSLNSAVANAVLDGVTVVVAAGNNNGDASAYSPASEPSVITVGAVSMLDSRSVFSNFGPSLDIFAPGQIITSTYHRSSTDLRGLSGTSMAAPHVAGAAALLLEENPNLTPAQVASDLMAYATPDVVTDAGSGSPNRLLFTQARWTAPTPETPSAPQALSVIGGVGQAALAWTAPTQSGSAAVTDYIVEFSSDNGLTWTTFADGVSTATSATVTELMNGVTYSFRVSAVNSSGTSPASDIARAAVGVPSVPTGLTAIAGTAQVILNWIAPSQSGGSEIADYLVEFRVDGVDVWSTFADGVSTETAATVTGLTNGITHSFRVSAVNAIGVGGASNTTTAVPWQAYVPSAPRDLVITSVMATSISLEWRIPAVDGGGFITGYVVEQSDDGGTAWSTSVVTGTGGRAGGIWFTTAYDLVSGREYRFRVTATNSAGNSEPSVSTAPRAPGVPSQPEDVRAVGVGPRRVMLRWERPLSNGGVSLSGYTIDYSTDNGESWTTWSQNTGVIDCTCQYMARTVTDLTDGVEHIFRIKAYNTVGASQPSEPTDPMTPLTPQPPTEPLGLTGTATPAIVELDWEAPANDNGAPITDYVVEFSTNSGVTWTTFSDGVSTATLASLRGLTAGLAHVFRVSAMNSAGQGLPSATSSAVTTLAPLENDAFSGATPIVCGGSCANGTYVRTTSSTRSATREVGEPQHGGYGASASLWYSFSLSRAGIIVIDTMGSDFDTLLGVYTGSVVNALTTVITNDDAGGGNWSRVEVSPVVGTTYFVAIDGYGGRKGSTVLNWQFTESPPASKPGAPRNVRAVEGDTNATIYWSAPESDGGATITGYNVTASPGGQTCATTGSLTCVVTGLTNGTAYTFTATATNSVGTGNDSTPSEPVTPRSSSSGGIVPLSWGLDRIDQRELPLNNRFTRTQSGAGVMVYVIDTGVRATHSELSGRVATGFTTVSDGQGTNDCQGHGTHVAGTVAGTNYGVAPSALIVPVRVMNCGGSGSTSDIISGIDWIITHHQAGVPAVANMSLGGPRSAALDLAVSRGVADGVTFVVAAGNSNVSACTVSPAGEPTAITVGSTTSSDERSSFSNFGSCLDVFAPGSSIESAGHSSDIATRTLSGTSMAAPHVAGVAALVLSQNSAMTPAEVTSAIASSATRNAVIDPGTGSLNRLVFSLLTPAPNTEDDTPTTTTSTTYTTLAPTTTAPSGDDGDDDDEPVMTTVPVTTTLPQPTPVVTPTTTSTTTSTTAPLTSPTTSTTVLTATASAPRGIVPAVGQRPAVGTPAPQLPLNVRALAASVRAVGRTLRIETQAPKGSLVHIYRKGVLVRSVTPEEAKSIVIPAAGASADDVQIVVVTRTGEVLTTPPTEKPEGTDGTDLGSASGDESSTTVTTQPMRSSTGKPNAGGAAAGKAASTKAAPKPATGKTATKPATKTGQRQASDKNK